ncbi:MAG TPA: hypothetical protein PLI18_19370, partial [Pirellulaceae bacterium]|nr:hypothetical protein [Pirellulaceae bacterium]
MSRLIDGFWVLPILQTSIGMTLGALLVAELLRRYRPADPLRHRLAWGSVLLLGIVPSLWSVSIPTLPTIGSDPSLANEPSESPDESFDDPR